MSLPAPRLDDRRFQDIVDEAKRLIPRYCPEWTDHNVSDPGVALIELFAWMSEMILYRLNQVPESMYVKFLELMGIRLFPPSVARANLTFWLSAPQPAPVIVPAGTQVGTMRTEYEESIVFTTDRDLKILQPELEACLTGEQDRYQDRWDDLRAPNLELAIFASTSPGDAFYLGFADSLAGNTLRLEVTATIEGVGVDPHRPPWAWEAWDGEAWAPIRVHEDSTGGFNRDGSVTLLLPEKHEPLTVGPTRSHWIRCRMTEAVGDQPPYQESPEVRTLKAKGLGGTVSASHSRQFDRTQLGVSDGTHGQSFRVRNRPVLPRRPDEHVVVVTKDGEEEWREVSDFADSTPEDRVYVWDGVAGTIDFAPRVHQSDGTIRDFGAIPPPDAKIVVTGYRTGGGAKGNVGPGTLSVLKTSLPFVSRVENLERARGGVDAETIENAKTRGPLSLRSGQRAVTTGDFETLTMQASPEVARARCLPPEEPGGPVRLLVVPRPEVDPTHLELDDLAIPDPLFESISEYIDERRTIGSAVEVGTPSYQGVTVVTRLRATDAMPADLVKDQALELLYGYINPLIGGPEGDGWPFDRSLNIGELFALLAGIDGVVGVEDVRIFLADLRTGERSRQVQRAALDEEALFMSYQHTVVIG